MIMWDSEMDKTTVEHSKLRHFRNYRVQTVYVKSLAVHESQHWGGSREKIRVLLCIEGFFTLGFVDSGHFFVSVSLSILLGEVGWELGRLLLYSYVSLFFSLGSRALTIYFMFYNCSDLNCLLLSCFNLLIFCRKVWRDLWFEGRRGV